MPPPFALRESKGGGARNQQVGSMTPPQRQTIRVLVHGVSSQWGGGPRRVRGAPTWRPVARRPPPVLDLPPASLLHRVGTHDALAPDVRWTSPLLTPPPRAQASAGRGVNALLAPPHSGCELEAIDTLAKGPGVARHRPNFGIARPGSCSSRNSSVVSSRWQRSRAAITTPRSTPIRHGPRQARAIVEGRAGPSPAEPERSPPGSRGAELDGVSTTPSACSGRLPTMNLLGTQGRPCPAATTHSRTATCRAFSPQFAGVNTKDLWWG